ncbi:MAG: Fibronectin type domain protein [Frankiales bacterium]|nr:Fibronectin type domain protein [Frankiales bacterium]
MWASSRLVTFFALAGVAALGSIGAVGSALGAATVMRGAGAGLAAGAGGARAVAAGAVPGRTTAAASEDKPRKSGKVAAAQVKHLDVARGAESLGDRSPTWRLPGSSRVDAWGRRWPALVGPVSPLVARLMTDGAYLRAMLGSVEPTVVLSAVAAAVVAGAQTGALAAPAAGAVGIITAAIAAWFVPFITDDQDASEGAELRAVHARLAAMEELLGQLTAASVPQQRAVATRARKAPRDNA